MLIDIEKLNLPMADNYEVYVDGKFWGCVKPTIETTDKLAKE